jgi:arginyl-tRNA--protein-N-Asp/Glu arginylyltransferase
MTLLHDLPLQRLQFYVTTPYACGYLKGRRAQSLIAVPHHLIDTGVYGELVQMGFRRSGRFTYRPHCENCNACVPVRLPVAQFQPSRSQRRALARHANLATSVKTLEFSQEHYALYRAYQQARHPSGDMDAEDPNQYRNFLMQSKVDSVLVEFREQGVLRMVSVVDCLADGLSAVYTFYDNSNPTASYGTYAVLWLIEWCRNKKLPYLFLGYWIRDCRKMAYKINFSPLEGLVDEEWRPLNADGSQ